MIFPEKLGTWLVISFSSFSFFLGGNREGEVRQLLLLVQVLINTNKAVLQCGLR